MQLRTLLENPASWMPVAFGQTGSLTAPCLVDRAAVCVLRWHSGVAWLGQHLGGADHKCSDKQPMLYSMTRGSTKPVDVHSHRTWSTAMAERALPHAVVVQVQARRQEVAVVRSAWSVKRPMHSLHAIDRSLTARKIKVRDFSMYSGNNSSHTSMYRHYNCSHTAMCMHYNSSHTVTYIHYNCSHTAMHMHYNCSYTAMKMLYNCSHTAMNMHYNGNNCSHTAKGHEHVRHLPASFLFGSVG